MLPFLPMQPTFGFVSNSSILKTYNIQELTELGGPEFLAHLARPNTFQSHGRSPEQMQADRNWGDWSELAFAIDTGVQLSSTKYQDFEGSCDLYGIELDGTIELKTIQRPSGASATEAILNYMNKGSAGRKAKFFVVYYADRENGMLYPFGLYQRGFAGSVVPRALLYPEVEIMEYDDGN